MVSFPHIAAGDIVSIPQGTVLMKQGEKGNCAYLLLQGKMLVYRQGKNEMIPLGEVTPVNIIGELAILNSVPRTATVIAAEECKLLELNQHRLKSIIRRYPDIAEIIIKVMCNRLIHTTEQLAEAKGEKPAIKTQNQPQKPAAIPAAQTPEEQRSAAQRMATINRRDQ